MDFEVLPNGTESLLNHLGYALGPDRQAWRPESEGVTHPGLFVDPQGLGPGSLQCLTPRPTNRPDLEAFWQRLADQFDPENPDWTIDGSVRDWVFVDPIEMRD